MSIITCLVNDCQDTKILARGWCRTHYKRWYRHGDPLLLIRSGKHHMTNTSEFRIWKGMVYRCYKPYSTPYIRYGGKGIKVCDRWRNNFSNFYEDMGARPSAKHQIDRIDNSGDYTPENCKWSTTIEQGNNKSTNTRLTFNGVTNSLAQWARELNLNYDALVYRIHHGWSIDRALNTPTPQGFTGTTKKRSIKKPQ